MYIRSKIMITQEFFMLALFGLFWFVAGFAAGWAAHKAGEGRNDG